MKKISAIIIMFLYMIPAIGISMQQHYCDGKWASVSILFTENPSCACGKKVMKKDCCKDKTTIVKITDTQNYSKKVETVFTQKAETLVQIFPLYNYHFTEFTFEKHYHIANHPPWQKSNPLYLLHQVFLI